MTDYKPKTRITLGAASGLLMRRVGKILMVTVIAAILMYVCFAATIIRIIPATNIPSITVVKENTFEGGIVPAGELIVVNPYQGEAGVVKDGYADRLLQGVAPNPDASVVQVVAGPFADLTWMESGLVQIDGELMDVTLDEEPVDQDGKTKRNLNGEYLVQCIAGSCHAGDGMILSGKNLYGLLVEREGQREQYGMAPIAADERSGQANAEDAPQPDTADTVETEEGTS